MRITFLAFAAFLFGSIKVHAQDAQCLYSGKAPGSFHFRGDEFTRYLHMDRYKVILFGEYHNGSVNPELEYDLITSVNKTNGIRHIFKEMGVSGAWHFNQFLKTGDTSYLSHPALIMTYGNWPRFWRRLYAYNLSLPDDQKLIFHGLDFESTDVFETILKLAPTEQAVPLSLKAAMDTVRAHLADKPYMILSYINGKFTEYDNSGFMRTLDFIRLQFRQHPQEAAAYFGANYSVIRDIALNESRVIVKARPRNITMFDAMQRITQEQGIKKFLGVFGAEHTTYTSPTSIANAVARLDGISEVDVLNIREIVYNLRKRSDSTIIPTKDSARIIPLNGNCSASIVPAKSVYGYGRSADYIIIADADKFR